MSGRLRALIDALRTDADEGARYLKARFEGGPTAQAADASPLQAFLAAPQRAMDNVNSLAELPFQLSKGFGNPWSDDRLAAPEFGTPVTQAAVPGMGGGGPRRAYSSPTVKSGAVGTAPPRMPWETPGAQARNALAEIALEDMRVGGSVVSPQKARAALASSGAGAAPASAIQSLATKDGFVGPYAAEVYGSGANMRLRPFWEDAGSKSGPWSGANKKRSAGRESVFWRDTLREYDVAPQTGVAPPDRAYWEKLVRLLRGEG